MAAPDSVEPSTPTTTLATCARRAGLTLVEHHHRAAGMVDNLRGHAPEEPPAHRAHTGLTEQDDLGVELSGGAQQRRRRPAANDPRLDVSALGGVILEVQQPPLPLSGLGNAVLGRRQQGTGTRGVRSVLGQWQIRTRVQQRDLRLGRASQPDGEEGRRSRGA
jgi:hypothetical protein